MFSKHCLVQWYDKLGSADVGHLSTKLVTVGLSHTSRRRLRGGNPHDNRDQWLENVYDMAQNRSQQHLYLLHILVQILSCGILSFQTIFSIHRLLCNYHLLNYFDLFYLFI